jgi:hypothetical protein
MAMNFINLDSATRRFMVEEINNDIKVGTLYESPRLSPLGTQQYPELLRTAAQDGSDDSFAAELRVPVRLNTTEQRRNPKGGMTLAKVPITAPETLAEGEFNRFYARGLCLRAMAQGIESLVVYRAKDVVNPRPESVALIGKSLPAKQLLDDLRANPGKDIPLGLPPGPNSGLSVKLA